MVANDTRSLEESLAGSEHGHPAKEHKESFQTAAGAGLGITVHAG